LDKEHAISKTNKASKLKSHRRWLLRQDSQDVFDYTLTLDIATAFKETPDCQSQQDEDEDPLIKSTQTPPSYDSDDDNDNDIFSYAAHVLATEAAALASITTLYRSSAIAKQNLKAAVKTIVQTQHDRGKLIVTGVGKSAYIGQKLVATCKSMGVAASFMHACEAAHGDLGDIRDVSSCN
jgi:hypothetical protein